MRVRRREKVKAAGGMVLWFGKCAAGKNERRLFLCAVKNPQDARVPVACAVSLCFCAILCICLHAFSHSYSFGMVRDNVYFCW